MLMKQCGLIQIDVLLSIGFLVIQLAKTLLLEEREFWLGGRERVSKKERLGRMTVISRTILPDMSEKGLCDSDYALWLHFKWMHEA